MDAKWIPVIVAVIGAVQILGGAAITYFVAIRTTARKIEQERLKDDATAAQIYQGIAAESGKAQLTTQETIKDLTAQLAASHLSQQQSTKLLAVANQKMIDAQASAARLQKQNEDLQLIVENDIIRDDGNIRKIGTLERELSAQTTKARNLEADKKIMEQDFRAQLSRMQDELSSAMKKIDELQSSLTMALSRIDELTLLTERLMEWGNNLVDQLNPYRKADNLDPLPRATRKGLSLKLNV